MIVRSKERDDGWRHFGYRRMRESVWKSLRRISPSRLELLHCCECDHFHFKVIINSCRQRL